MPEFRRTCVEPIYQQIETYLRNQIIEGRLKPGARLPPENILAMEYGVSPLTLRRALGRLVHGGLLRRKQRKGTFVADIRSPAGPTRHCVMVIAPIEKLTFFRDEYYAGVMRGAEPVLREHECDLLLVSKRGESYTTLMGKNPSVDGALVLSLLRSQLNDLLEANKNAMPFVVIGSNEEGTRIVSVDSDKEAGGCLATKYLMDKGCKRVGFVGMRGDENDNIRRLMRERLQGCRQALKEHGLSYDKRWYVELPGNQPSFPLRELETLVRSRRPDGLVVLAAGETGKTAVAYLRYAGLNIPKDIRVVGLDDWGGVFSKPGIPYVRNPVEEIGQAAATALIELMQRSGKRTSSRKIPVELVGIA